MCEYVKIKLERYNELHEEIESYRKGLVSITNMFGDTFYLTETEALLKIADANKELNERIKELEKAKKNKRWFNFLK